MIYVLHFFFCVTFMPNFSIKLSLTLHFLSDKSFFSTLASNSPLQNADDESGRLNCHLLNLEASQEQFLLELQSHHFRMNTVSSLVLWGVGLSANKLLIRSHNLISFMLSRYSQMKSFMDTHKDPAHQIKLNLFIVSLKQEIIFTCQKKVDQLRVASVAVCMYVDSRNNNKIVLYIHAKASN